MKYHTSEIHQLKKNFSCFLIVCLVCRRCTLHMYFIDEQIKEVFYKLTPAARKGILYMHHALTCIIPNFKCDFVCIYVCVYVCTFVCVYDQQHKRRRMKYSLSLENMGAQARTKE